MQQRQATTTELSSTTLEGSRSTFKSAPVELDAAVLDLVAGGAEGPHGGWVDAVVTAGPHGGW